MASTDATQLPYRPCVGIVLINSDGLVWIGRRVLKWEGDGSELMWQMPQGGIEEGERPLDAALRELKEETGTDKVDILGESQHWLAYDLPEELVGMAFKGRYRGQRLKWFAMRFLGSDGDINISERPGQRTEFDAWRWAEMAALPELIVPFKRQVYDRVTAEFSHLTRVGFR